MLSIVSSVYDPISLIRPYVWIAKKLFQQERRTKKGWDDQLEESVKAAFVKWLDKLPKLVQVSIPRCVTPKQFADNVDARIHQLYDASQDAYGTVSYLGLGDTVGNTHCSFLLGKSRLAPIKQLSIPRLELSAATMAVRIDNQLRREMMIPLQESVLWCDSLIVLGYINNKKRRFQTFVANRVAVINDESAPDQWRYVLTQDNVADDATRGLKAHEVKGRWTSGPVFLLNDESTWPSTPAYIDIPTDDPEVKRNAKVCLAETCCKEDLIQKLFHRYSS